MHNETCDFYAHMSLTHERRFAGCFCRYSENGAVAQLMEFIDRSGSSFALIKRFLSLQKTQKIKW